MGITGKFLKVFTNDEGEKFLQVKVAGQVLYRSFSCGMYYELKDGKLIVKHTNEQ